MNNALIFEAANRIKYLKGAYEGYICTMCGNITHLNDAFSYQGYSMRCPICYYKLKHDDPDALELVHETGKMIMGFFEQEEE